MFSQTPMNSPILHLQPDCLSAFSFQATIYQCHGQLPVSKGAGQNTAFTYDAVA